MKGTVDLTVFDREGDWLEHKLVSMCEIENVISQAVQLVRIQRSARRSSGDMTAALAVLERAVLESGVMDTLPADFHDVAQAAA